MQRSFASKAADVIILLLVCLQILGWYMLLSQPERVRELITGQHAQTPRPETQLDLWYCRDVQYTRPVIWNSEACRWAREQTTPPGDATTPPPRPP